jgi:hypothetical protein
MKLGCHNFNSDSKKNSNLCNSEPVFILSKGNEKWRCWKGNVAIYVFGGS